MSSGGAGDGEADVQQRSQPADVVIVGRIRGAYGIQGWVHVQAFTEPKDNLKAYRPWLLAPPGSEGAKKTDETNETNEKGWHPVTVAEIRAHKQDFIARLDGVHERTGADALKGSWIGVRAEALEPAQAGEYYWRDLIGARVENAAGETLGVVQSLLETGAHDVLVIEPPDRLEGDAGQLLIPFHDRYLLDVDVARGWICVDWTLADDD